MKPDGVGAIVQSYYRHTCRHKPFNPEALEVVILALCWQSARSKREFIAEYRNQTGTYRTLSSVSVDAAFARLLRRELLSREEIEDKRSGCMDYVYATTEQGAVILKSVARKVCKS